MPSHPGEHAESARRCGNLVITALIIGHTRSSWLMPTCTCVPHSSICWPQYWVRLMISEYVCFGETGFSRKSENGCPPDAQGRSPMSWATCLTMSNEPRKSAIASGTVSHTPVTSSTVFWRNSFSRWVSGASSFAVSMSSAARGTRSRVTGSTSATSHSTPSVGRGERANFSAGISTRIMLRGGCERAAYLRDFGRYKFTTAQASPPSRPYANSVQTKRDFGDQM